MSRRLIAPVLVLALALSAAPALAESRDVSASEALDLARTGEAVLVDIRTPDEWRQTGVAPGAERVNLYVQGGPAAFLQGILDAVDGDKAKPVALICRTGNRTTKAAEFLRAQGFTNVLNVKEGMAGSGAGPGWLKRGLPVEPCNC